MAKVDWAERKATEIYKQSSYKPREYRSHLEELLADYDGWKDWERIGAWCGTAVIANALREARKLGEESSSATNAALVTEVQTRREQNAADGEILIQCLTKLGLDVSGTDTTAIPPAIDALLARAEAAEKALEEARKVIAPFAERVNDFILTFGGMATVEFSHLRHAAEWMEAHK